MEHRNENVVQILRNMSWQCGQLDFEGVSQRTSRNPLAQAIENQSWHWLTSLMLLDLEAEKCDFMKEFSPPP